jgi:hypothetical protein
MYLDRKNSGTISFPNEVFKEPVIKIILVPQSKKKSMTITASKLTDYRRQGI